MKKPKKPVAPVEPIKPKQIYTEDVNKQIHVTQYSTSIQDIIDQAGVYGITDFSSIVLDEIYSDSYDTYATFIARGKVQRNIDDAIFKQLMSDYKSRHEEYVKALGEYNKAMAEYEQVEREKTEAAERKLLEKLQKKYQQG